MYKKIYVCLIPNKVLLKSTKTRHYWTSQLIRNTKSLIGVRRVNKKQVLIYDVVKMNFFNPDPNIFYHLDHENNNYIHAQCIDAPK